MVLASQPRGLEADQHNIVRDPADFVQGRRSRWLEAN